MFNLAQDIKMIEDNERKNLVDSVFLPDRSSRSKKQLFNC
ncbi:hypothetical protein Cabys_3773 [Caldithrix abyssi DSM 13497]|uniref:Uncharacterized protein n=1 Tax=Caldithrix abyssi DSM 13497 TaxID=880073 RepID=A0A1J1CD80_CALAY|nr:hypothetical protein Cabys_3773 [Caldithrix abyssi DSM 13497]